MNRWLIGIGGGILVMALLYMGGCVHYKGKEVRLRNTILAQKKVNEANYDTMWKVVKQLAGVKDDYKEAFGKIYKDLIEGRYGNEKGGSLMKFIQESNPTFDTRLYEKLANAIEAKRTEFFEHQKALAVMKSQHDNLRQEPISGLFVGGVPEIEITIVTSTKTEETFKSGKEDDVDLKK